ncbi:MAG: hypothetical protein FWD65_04045 [Coriobacteriia bacterium]|nr:hypothetical protein [Coriobacteriia bacterium]
MSALWKSITEALNLNSVSTIDPGRIITIFREIIADPGSNIKASFMALALVTVVLLIIMVSVIIVILRISEHDKLLVRVTGAEKLDKEQQEELDEQIEEIIKEDHKPLPRRVLTVVIGLICLLAIWVMVGYSSSLNSTCLSCHKNTPHLTAKNDPHAQTRCVRCHESSSQFSMLITAVPQRLIHFVNGANSKSPSDAYGSVSSNNCLACHKKRIADTTITNKSTGVRMSHRAPLKQKMACIDCHVISEGSVITAQNRGMTSCNRCHNNVVASPNCKTCHEKDYTAALAGNKEALANFSERLVPNPGCSSCHNMPRDCDPCHHGVPMPHSEDFMKLGHAYVATNEIWNGTISPTCINNECHNNNNHPCTACHQTTKFPAHGMMLKELHKTYDPKTASCTCHEQTSGTHVDRNFCIEVCHRPGTNEPQLQLHN